MAVDAIQERGEIEQLVTRFDELEVENLLLAWHGGTIGRPRRAVNRQERLA
jgi:hypothetical protein